MTNIFVKDDWILHGEWTIEIQERMQAKQKTIVEV